MATRQSDPMGDLQTAFSLLFKNWVLAVPTAIFSLAVAVFFFLVIFATLGSLVGAGIIGANSNPSSSGVPPGIWGALAAGGVTLIVGCIVLALLGLLAQAVVIGGAERVWHGQPPDLTGGIGRALGKLPALILLFIIGAIVFVICAIIIIVGWIGGLVLAFFAMYTVPAIVVGNEGVFAAIGSSFRIVSRNIGPSLLAFLAIFVVSFVGSIIERLFLHGLWLYAVAATIIGGLTSAYAAIVLVRFYDVLRGATPTAPAATSGPTT